LAAAAAAEACVGYVCVLQVNRNSAGVKYTFAVSNRTDVRKALLVCYNCAKFWRLR
jgi:hypothetical protein